MYVLLFSNVTFVITVTTYLFETKHHKYNFRKKNSTVSACQKLVDWKTLIHSLLFQHRVVTVLCH